MFDFSKTYLIRHKPSGILYHGSRTAKDCKPEELLKPKGYKTSSKVVKDLIQKDGLESFEIVSIEIYFDTREARLAEESYHKEYDVESNVCYFNRHNAGNTFSTSGFTKSEEVRKRVSMKLKGRKHTDEHRRKNSEGLKGRIITEEAKRKISEKNKGRVQSEEQRRKNSEANKGRPKSPETRKRMSEAAKGRSKSQKHKDSMSKARKGKSTYTNTTRISCVICRHETSLNKFNSHIINKHG